jgi:hypothetical protein
MTQKWIRACWLKTTVLYQINQLHFQSWGIVPVLIRIYYVK